jgi:hypothetical protein
MDSSIASRKGCLEVNISPLLISYSASAKNENFIGFTAEIHRLEPGSLTRHDTTRHDTTRQYKQAEGNE